MAERGVKSRQTACRTMIQYQSTRGDNRKKNAARAVIRGIAEDRGLYVPDRIPSLPVPPEQWAGKSYQEIAERVIGLFFTDYTKEEIAACVKSAYDEKFESAEIAPMTEAGGVWFLELYHGKTAAFKDMALSILPYLLTTALRKEKEEKEICILTATSGDTGKAALEGFADVDGTRIIVFYPDKGVSQVQERQMTTQEGKNTFVYAIEGNFDDAQTGVKEIFNDAEFARTLEEKGVKLSSANSINIGRLIPQAAYYVYAYASLLKRGAVRPGEGVNIAVPTGNFGNILAAYYAGQMGIPVRRLICASNENKVLTDFINTGVYDTNRAFFLTNSPSMDILISSNLERLLYHLSGGRGEEIRELMEQLDKNRKYRVSDRVKQGLSAFYGGFATVAETNKTIGDLYRQHGYLTDTHTAVAYKVYQDYRRETGDETVTILASTASAYKFAGSVTESIGLAPSENGFEDLKKLEKETGVRVPAGLKGLEDRPVLHKETIPVKEMKDAVLRAVVRGK